MTTVSQRHRRTEGRTTYDSNAALSVVTSRGKNWTAVTFSADSNKSDPISVIFGTKSRV